jgi:hypothetical protein
MRGYNVSMKTLNIDHQTIKTARERRALLLATVGAVAALLTVALASCSSASTTTSPQSAPAATQTAPIPSNQPSSSDGPGRFRPGASGTIAQVSGSTITLNGQSGQITVNVPANAVIQKTVSATASDLEVGQTVSVVGIADANGVIAASQISVRPDNVGSPSFIPPAGANSSPRAPRPSGTPPGGFQGGNVAVGTIAALNGNTITVTNTQSQETTVTIGPNTAIDQVVSGSQSDLKVGEFVSAIGNTDQNGNVQATFVTIGQSNPAANP